MSLPAEREKSRKKMMSNARAQIDEGLEKQRVRQYNILRKASTLKTPFIVKARDRCGCPHQTLQSTSARLISRSPLSALPTFALRL